MTSQLKTSLDEIRKGCGGVTYISPNYEVSYKCNKKGLYPSCQSRLDQFKEDVEMFKKEIKVEIKSHKEHYPKLSAYARAKHKHTIIILKKLLAPLDEVLKEMGK